MELFYLSLTGLTVNPVERLKQTLGVDTVLETEVVV